MQLYRWIGGWIVMDRDELRVQVTSVGPAAKRTTLDMQYRREAFAVRAARCVRQVDSRIVRFCWYFKKLHLRPTVLSGALFQCVRQPR